MSRKNNITDIGELLRDDPDRNAEMCRETNRWRLELARVPVTRTLWHEWFESDALGPITEALSALFGGQIVNASENQPALHMALRDEDPGDSLSSSDATLVREAREAMLDVATRLFTGQTAVRTLLHVGIGGSDLGPRLVTQALDRGHSAVDVEWLTTLDARRLERLMAELDPETTGMVIASKSFGTVETLKQARLIRDWMGPDFAQRCWAATANPGRARDFGMPSEQVIAFPHWVGGRFSLWSSVGLSAAARIGSDAWRQLLSGASDADRQVFQKPARSPALALARVIDVLVRNQRFATLGVVSYDPGLRLLAEYLQQLIMESLGKSVGNDGRPVRGPTTPVVFGGAGTDLQHSLFQALHQGTERHPIMLLGSAGGEERHRDWRLEQLAHLMGQASALVEGKSDSAAEKVLPGNNPVMLMLARSMDAASVGELLALFEHAVFLLGVLWQVNPFDQWGVEEGKRLAVEFRRALEDTRECPDPAMKETLAWIRRFSA